MLLGVTESVLNPSCISWGMALESDANSPQILTGFFTELTICSSTLNTTGESASILSVGCVRSMAKRYCVGHWYLRNKSLLLYRTGLM